MDEANEALRGGSTVVVIGALMIAVWWLRKHWR